MGTCLTVHLCIACALALRWICGSRLDPKHFRACSPFWNPNIFFQTSILPLPFQVCIGEPGSIFYGPPFWIIVCRITSPSWFSWCSTFPLPNRPPCLHFFSFLVYFYWYWSFLFGLYVDVFPVCLSILSPTYLVLVLVQSVYSVLTWIVSRRFHSISMVHLNSPLDFYRHQKKFVCCAYRLYLINFQILSYQLDL